MKAYDMSIESGLPVDDQLSRLDKYETGDLLYVLREIESRPTCYDEKIIKRVYGRLAEKRIFCV